MSDRAAVIGVWIPGVGHNVIWRHPNSTDRVEFEPLAEVVKTAERGVLDFVFLADGLSIPQHLGRFIEAGFNGRPDSLTIIPGLAAVTEHIGFVATLNTSFSEPYQLARQLATIANLSHGRVGWNIVTSNREGPIENFSPGHARPYEERYERAADFLRLSSALWNAEGTPVSQPGGRFRFDGTFSVPVPRHELPFLVQSGDSGPGRDFGAATADAIFTGQRTLGTARDFYSDVKRRVQEQGRDPESVKVLPGLSFVIGETEADARRRYDYLQDLRFSPGVVRHMLEQQWGVRLDDLDVSGPLPAQDPVLDPAGGLPPARGAGPVETVAHWRRLAAERDLSAAELIKHVYEQSPLVGSAVPGTSVVGTPRQIADFIGTWLDERGSDGFVIAPDVVPGQLDDFVDQVVPLLQKDGLLRAAYTATSLRDRALGPRSGENPVLIPRQPTGGTAEAATAK